MLDEIAAALGFGELAWCTATPERTTLRLVTATATEAEALAGRLDQALRAWADSFPAGPPRVATGSMAREDWAETWKKYFHPFRASRRFVVKPSWEAWSATPGDVVLELDPGTAFGTGQHGTTRACLEFIDAAQDELGGGAMLDAGCGSGILAMAGAQIGFGPVVALDNDPEAIPIAQENLRLAGCRDVAVICDDLAQFEPGLRFRLVVANILASVLVAQAARLVGFLDRDAGPARLVLSGILTSQYGAVRDCYLTLGLREQAVRTLDEWTSGVFALPR